MARRELFHGKILDVWLHTILLHLRHRNVIIRARHQQRRLLDMIPFLRHRPIIRRVQVRNLRFVPIQWGTVAAAAAAGVEDLIVGFDLRGRDP